MIDYNAKYIIRSLRKKGLQDLAGDVVKALTETEASTEEKREPRMGTGGKGIVVKAFNSKGRKCDKCDRSLDEEDYDKPGSWSYTCPSCGFRYKHGSTDVSGSSSSDYKDLLDNIQDLVSRSGKTIDEVLEDLEKMTGSSTACNDGEDNGEPRMGSGGKSKISASNQEEMLKDPLVKQVINNMKDYIDKLTRDEDCDEDCLGDLWGDYWGRVERPKIMKKFNLDQDDPIFEVIVEKFNS